MSECEVSFVIPVRNGFSTVVDCIESISNQKSTLKFEIIVVNNNSTDGTLALLKKNSQLNFKVVFESRIGRSFARNKGLEHSQGKWVCFIDCDVVLDPNWLENVKKVIIENDLDGGQGPVVPASKRVNSFSEYRKKLISLETKNIFIHLAHNGYFVPVINTAACVYKKSTLLEVKGFDPVLNIYEDCDLSGRIWMQGGVFATVPLALAFVYWPHGGFMSYLKRSWLHGRGQPIFFNLWKFRTFAKNFSLLGPQKGFENKYHILMSWIKYFVYMVALKTVTFYELNSKTSHLSQYRICKPVPRRKVIWSDDGFFLALPPTLRYYWENEHLFLKDILSRRFAFIPRKLAPASGQPIEEILKPHLRLLKEQNFFVRSIEFSKEEKMVPKKVPAS